MNAKISPHISILSVNDKNFSQSVKTLESVLDYDCSFEVIKNLMELYSLAIENYESVRDPAFAFYKQKLKNLLKRSDVQSEINKQHTDDTQKRPRASTNGPRKTRGDLSLERTAEKAMQWHYSENVITSEKIQENLKRQMDSLNLRINFRKKQASQNAKIVEFEKGVERIMEEFLQDKENAQLEIQKKYEEQLEELRLMPQSELILKVVEATNEQISKELEEKIRVIEANKRSKIRSLKAVIKLDL